MQSEMSYVNLRFTKEVDRMIRRKRKRGEMSRRVCAALSSIDLSLVSLTEIRGEARCGMTQVAVPEPLYLRGKALAEQRECSFNRLVNSALRAHLGGPSAS
jgi:hypothetical protein